DAFVRARHVVRDDSDRPLLGRGRLLPVGIAQALEHSRRLLHFRLELLRQRFGLGCHGVLLVVVVRRRESSSRMIPRGSRPPSPPLHPGPFLTAVRTWTIFCPMQVYVFDLMPWPPPTDPSYSPDPNRLYDPALGRQVYDEHFRQMEL